MKNLINIRRPYLVLILLCILASGCSLGEENRSPVLTGDMKITPEPPIYAGKVISIQISASDPDGDKIDYIWTAVNSKNANVTTEVFKGDVSSFAVNFKTDIPDTYLITVTAKDSEGNISRDYSFALTVLSGSNPTISILSPKSGMVQGMVNITVKANDDKGVTKVEFYIDGIRVAEKDAFPFSYSWDTTGLSGSHVIEAKAYDSDGNQGISESVLVTVQNLGETKITITEPQNGALVNWQTTVKGTYNGLPKGYRFWIFINPHTVGKWYPQSPPSLLGEKWQALCYFGREGKDQGVEFDVGVIVVDDERAMELAKKVEAGDPEPIFLFDPILAFITVKRN